jgi:hypothetical protein
MYRRQRRHLYYGGQIQTAHGPHIAERIQKAVYIVRCLFSHYGATTVAAESIIAQLDSQGKLTTPWRKNLKIWHKNKILKANEHLSYV